MTKKEKQVRKVSLRPDDAVLDNSISGKTFEEVLDLISLPEDDDAYVDCCSFVLLLDATIRKLAKSAGSYGAVTRYGSRIGLSLAQEDAVLRRVIRERNRLSESAVLSADRRALFYLHKSPQAFGVMTDPIRKQMHIWDKRVKHGLCALAADSGVKDYLLIMVYVTKAILSSNMDLGVARESLYQDIIVVWDSFLARTAEELSEL